MPKIDPKSGDRVYSLDIPHSSPKEDYKSAIFDNIMQIHWVVSQMESYSDIRVPMLVDLLINKVIITPDRLELKLLKEQMLEEVESTGKTGTSKDKAIIDLNISMVGFVMVWLDRHIGLEEKMEVMRVAKKRTGVREELKNNTTEDR